MKSLFAPVWIFGLFLVCTAGCSKPRALQYIDVQHFGINELGRGKFNLAAELKFYNPNPYKLRLKHAEMNLYVNNQYFGHSVLDTLMVIPRADTFLIPVSMKDVELKKVVMNGLGALLSNEYSIRLDGNARVGKAGFYHTFPLNYEGKQKLNLFR